MVGQGHPYVYLFAHSPRNSGPKLFNARPLPLIRVVEEIIIGKAIEKSHVNERISDQIEIWKSQYNQLTTPHLPLDQPTRHKDLYFILADCRVGEGGGSTA